MRSVAAKVHNGVSWLMFVGANLAFVLIALTVFGAGSPHIHAWGGRIVWFASLVAVIAALVARSSKRNIWLTILTSLLIFPGQGALAYADFLIQAVHALHAVNGLAIMWLSYSLATGKARATDPVMEAAPSIVAAD